MIRPVLDSNVLVSAVIKRGGKPYQILDQAPVAFKWLTSEYILSEVRKVVTRRHIQTKYSNRVTPESQDEFLATVRALAEVIVTTSTLSVVPDDLKDNPVLACAVDGEADYLVTGDRHLLQLGTFAGIQIVTPDSFLKLLVESS